MLQLPDWIGTLTEIVKLLGAVASFYVLVKLRKIEKRYLFKATAPGIIANLEVSLKRLNVAMATEDRTVISEALNFLSIDARNALRKSPGEVRGAAEDLLIALSLGRKSRWSRRHVVSSQLTLDQLLDVFGKGMGLIRALENELHDYGWRFR